MGKAEEFTTWAAGEGVKIDGVAIKDYDGRGFGLVATKDIEVSITSHSEMSACSRPVLRASKIWKYLQLLFSREIYINSSQYQLLINILT